MLWGYNGKTPDGEHDDLIALVALLYWQGLSPGEIDEGVYKKYKQEVDSRSIIMNLPSYFGANGYKPVKVLLDVKKMLSGEIP